MEAQISIDTDYNNTLESGLTDQKRTDTDYHGKHRKTERVPSSSSSSSATSSSSGSSTQPIHGSFFSV